MRDTLRIFCAVAIATVVLVGGVVLVNSGKPDPVTTTTPPATAGLEEIAVVTDCTWLKLVLERATGQRDIAFPGPDRDWAVEKMAAATSRIAENNCA